MITKERRAELLEMNDVHAVTKEGIFRINTPEFNELLDDLKEVEEDHERVRDGVIKHNYEIEQALGKALGYPSGYPEVAEVDDGSVCVPVDTVTLAEEAAAKIKELQARIDQLTADQQTKTWLLSRRHKLIRKLGRKISSLVRGNKS